jgi:uncharacterized protein YgiM (DUF1202 family)
MKFRQVLKAGYPVILLLLLASACATPYPSVSVSPQPPAYYVIPATTYLRSCAGYDCSVIEMLYGGDRVGLLERNEFGWSHVRLFRTGQDGWVPSDLLSYTPRPSLYYVAWNSVYIRECADYNCRGVLLLRRGDRVERLDQDFRGWWRVRSANTGIQGWIPASSVSPQAGPPYLYVAVSSLALRTGPSTASRMITSLSLNTKVEMLETGPGGWAQVRVVNTGAMGWAYSRYLESFPVKHPRAVSKKKAPAAKSKALKKKGQPQPPPPETPEPKTEEPAPEAPVKPKPM